MAANQSLTGRRKQFLKALLDMYEQTHLPVHYDTLSKVLGVSKHTAYDVLNALEKQAYLTREYVVNPRETGRSQLVFVPTEKANQLFSVARAETEPEAWADTKDDVMRFLTGLHRQDPHNALKELLGAIPKLEDRVTFCAYIIGILLVYVQMLGTRTEALITLMVTNATDEVTRLSVFVGAVMGSLVESTSGELGEDLVALVGRFINYLSSLSEAERHMLVGVLDEALARRH